MAGSLAKEGWLKENSALFVQVPNIKTASESFATFQRSFFRGRCGGLEEGRLGTSSAQLPGCESGAKCNQSIQFIFASDENQRYLMPKHTKAWNHRSTSTVP